MLKDYYVASLLLKQLFVGLNKLCVFYGFLSSLKIETTSFLETVCHQLALKQELSVLPLAEKCLAVGGLST